MRYKYTEDDIKFLKVNYPLGEWDKIHKRFPFLTDSAIHHKCSRLGIKFDLKNRNNKNCVNSYKKWSKEEIKILEDNYPTRPISEVESMLPGRTKSMIINKANLLKITSYRIIKTKWNDDEIQYLYDNWMLTPDVIMAINLNRTQRAVQAKRLELGLCRMDTDSSSYPTLSKYFRGQNYEWKIQSMKNCDYKCVITGSKDFEIHHLYGVSNIISDIINMYPKYKNIKFEKLTNADLEFLTTKFIEHQSQYPLGECIRKDLHVLFHSLYGQYYNTPEQWYKFKIDYQKGVYNNIA